MCPSIFQITENLGIEMIFSLVSSAQEWLNVKWDEHIKEIENKEMEKVKAFEEAEQVNILYFWHGVPPINWTEIGMIMNLIFVEKIRRHTCDSRNIFDVAQ